MRRVAVVAVGCVLALTACSGGGRSKTTSHGRPLTSAEVRTLVEDGERRLMEAYATGDASHLADFLAGPQLRGNAATIGVLNGRHQRNVFHVVVDSVTVLSATGDRVTVALQDHTTDNAFVDATTGQALNGGLPGPEVQSFVLFFDRNPNNGRWYWTGAQKQQR